jgi:hypothetical protein
MSFSVMSVSDSDAELSGEVKVLKMPIRAARAILYRSSCVVIWHIISFGHKYTDSPSVRERPHRNGEKAELDWNV